jgi:long-chain acyl-CoA synthetase
VIRGGYNVYPREIEEVLYAHPAILEAAVIGKPDERLGEEVVAVVALRPGHEVTAQEIIAYTRERLAAYKYPREIRFMAELPKGPSGKILKTALRDLPFGRAGRLYRYSPFGLPSALSWGGRRRPLWSIF